MCAVDQMQLAPFLRRERTEEGRRVQRAPMTIEALDCFLRTRMDLLVLGNFLVSRQT